MDVDPEMEGWKKAYEDLSTPQLVTMASRYIEVAPQHRAAKELIAEREESGRAELLKRLDMMGAKPEWRMYSFWLALLALAVAIAALARDYLDWTAPHRLPGSESDKPAAQTIGTPLSVHESSVKP